MDCLFEELKGVGGDIGLITLNRPRALNALTQAMCIAMDEQLSSWEARADIKAVIVTGAGEKAFCAGGDIRAIYDLGKAHPDKAAQFFYHEYHLNRHIYHTPKPYVALLDGVTMGGGVGISVHGSHQVATERLLLAMPETAIGFFPDVGGSYVLPRCPDAFGFYLALTGARINALDACQAGLVSHTIEHKNLGNLIDALCESAFVGEPKAAVSHLLADFQAPQDLAITLPPAAEISRCFGQKTLADILATLSTIDQPWAQKALTQLAKFSPTSLKVTFKQLQTGLGLDFDDCMALEYQLAQRFIAADDFYEGVRALLVDKDGAPKWQPQTLAEVQEQQVEDYFKPQADDKRLN